MKTYKAAFNFYLQQLSLPFELLTVRRAASFFLNNIALRDEPVAVQVHIGSSVFIYIYSRSAISNGITVEHGYEIYLKPAELIARFLLNGVNVLCFESKSTASAVKPSVFRVSSGAKIENNNIIWNPSFAKKGILFSENESSHLNEIQENNKEIENSIYSIEKSEIVIAVPVFNSPHHFSSLFGDLKRTLKFVDLNECSVKLIVIDDECDVFSENEVRKQVFTLKEHLDIDIHLYRNEKNKGFIRSCNDMFDRFGRAADYFILLTTDIRLPDGWVDRLLRGFTLDGRVAIATPLAVNGANLAIDIPEGCFWSDLDKEANKIQPIYPDAETTVGYCMAVRSSTIHMPEPLFMEHFENGYGDDSDLYYRTVRRGLRGVLVDNLVIFHEGGGSFDTLSNVEALRSKNWNIFCRDWISTHLERYEKAAEAVAAAVNIVRESTKLMTRHCSAVFILPIDDRRIGGVDAVFKIVEKLNYLGQHYHIVCLNKSNYTTFRFGQYQAMYRSENEDILEMIDFLCPKVVIATSFDTVPYVLASCQFSNAKSAYFVQGPEFAFSSGAYSPTVRDGLKKVDQILCVSEYLQDMVENLAQRQSLLIPYGPEPLEFYNNNVGARSGVLVQYAGRSDKGSDLMGLAVPSLISAGYEVTAFGASDTQIQHDFNINYIGHASSSQLNRALNKHMYYLDLSRFEGLGMLLLESVFSGAVPVYMANGGSAEILRNQDVGIQLNTLADVHQIGSILRASKVNRQRLLKNAEHIKLSRNVEAAANAFKFIFG